LVEDLPELRRIVEVDGSGRCRRGGFGARVRDWGCHFRDIFREGGGKQFPLEREKRIAGGEEEIGNLYWERSVCQ